jgi:hypothetical protein
MPAFTEFWRIVGKTAGFCARGTESRTPLSPLPSATFIVAVDSTSS